MMTNNCIAWTAKKVIDIGVKLNVTPIVTELIKEKTSTGDNIKDCIYDYNNKYNVENIFINEWWAVEKNLSRDLIENNELVYDYNAMYDLWGRQGSGQALIVDNVFTFIANQRNKRLYKMSQQYVI